jgi:hypothetical protein
VLALVADLVTFGLQFTASKADFSKSPTRSREDPPAGRRMVGSTSILPLTLFLFQNLVKPEAAEGVEVPTALLFTGSYDEIRSSPTVHPSSPAVH